MISHLSRALVAAAVCSLTSACTYHEMTNPMNSLTDAVAPDGPPVPIENPSTRGAFYGEMPRAVGLGRVLEGHETEPRASVDSRLQQIETQVRNTLNGRGYSTSGGEVRVMVDYETCPTMHPGGVGWDHSVTVAFMNGDLKVGSSTCRWVNHESATIDSLLGTLTTGALARVPAATKTAASLTEGR